MTEEIIKELIDSVMESLNYLFLPELGKRYWGMHIWARGYFVSTVGIDSTVIRNYVKEQAEEQIREEQLRLWKNDSE
ncbi:MAG: transposase [Desulfobacterales bacterium]|nr:transposase [Desulfobacterales bacterium]